MGKILITGGAGFLGSWLTRVFCSFGYTPTLLSRPSTSINRLSGLPEIEIIRAEVGAWGEAIKLVQPSAMIALDWSGVGNAHRNKLNQHKNVERILGVAALAKGAGIEQYIGFGSQAEIGPLHSRIYEYSPCNPTTQYGKAKCETREGLTKLFSDTQVKFSWGRIFSTYGQMDSSNWLIPQMIESFKKQKKFEMTKGEQIWNYLHAYDFATAVIKILKSNTNLEVINIADPTPCKLIDIGIGIAQKMNSEELLQVGSVSYRDDQVMQLVPDVSKLLSLGWKPEDNLDSGLQQLINWYCEYSVTLELPDNKNLKLPKVREF